MQNLRVLERKDKKAFLQLLKKQFDFNDKLDYTFLINNKNKVFIVNKDIANIDLEKITLNSAGLYIAEFRNNEIRLSIEGSQLIGKEAKKNIIELDEKQARDWLKGKDIERLSFQGKTNLEKMRGESEHFDKTTKEQGFVILKHNKDYLGSGKAKENKILNFVPKTRRLNVGD